MGARVSNLTKSMIESLLPQYLATRNFEGRVWRDPLEHHTCATLVCCKCRWVVDESFLPIQDSEIDLLMILDRHGNACQALPIMWRRRTLPLLDEERVHPRCGHCNGSKRCFCILCREASGSEKFFTRRCSVCARSEYGSSVQLSAIALRS